MNRRIARNSRLLVLGLVLTTSTRLSAQIPAVPSVPSTASLPSSAQSALQSAQGGSGTGSGTQATPAASNSPVNSVNISQPCCSIWDKLGLKGVGKGVRGLAGRLFRTQLFQFIGGGILQPLAGATGLTPAVGTPEFNNAAGVGPAGAAGPGMPGAPGFPPPPPTPAELAGKIAADKKTVRFKVQAIRQLGNADASQYPEVVDSLLLALDDPSEEVRYEALLALRKVCSEGECDHKPHHHKAPDCLVLSPDGCAGCACQSKVMIRLIQLLEERVNGCLKERSPRIRQLAASMIHSCLMRLPEDRIAPPKALPDPPVVPLPDRNLGQIPPEPMPETGGSDSMLPPPPPAPEPIAAPPAPLPDAAAAEPKYEVMEVPPVREDPPAADIQPAGIIVPEIKIDEVEPATDSPAPEAVNAEAKTEVEKETVLSAPPVREINRGSRYRGTVIVAKQEEREIPVAKASKTSKKKPGLFPTLWKRMSGRGSARSTVVNDPPLPDPTSLEAINASGREKENANDDAETTGADVDKVVIPAGHEDAPPFGVINAKNSKVEMTEPNVAKAVSVDNATPEAESTTGTSIGNQPVRITEVRGSAR